MTRWFGRAGEAELFAAMVDQRRPDLPSLRAGADGALAAELAELARLADQTRSLVPAGAAPAPQFRGQLRDRLLSEAASVVLPAPQAASDRGPDRTTSHPRHPRAARLRSAVATLALTAVVTGAGTAAASTRALPGDRLYDLKRGLESVQLALAFSDYAEGRELLEQAETRLTEAERLAGSEAAASPSTRALIEGVLAEWLVTAEAGVAELMSSYRESGNAESVALIAEFIDDQRERLRDLLVILDPALRGPVMEVLDILDEWGLRSAALLTSAMPRDGQSGGTTASGGAGSTLDRLADRLRGDGSAEGSADGALAGAAGTAGDGRRAAGDVLDGADSTAGAPGDLLDPLPGTGSGSQSGSGSENGSGSGDTDTGGGGGTGTESGAGGAVSMPTPGTTSSPPVSTEPLPTEPLPTEPLPTEPLPTLAPTEPLPTLEPIQPLPTVAPTVPLATLTATTLPTSALPTVTLPTCVPVPPATTC